MNIYRRFRWQTAEINPTLILINMKGQTQSNITSTSKAPDNVLFLYTYLFVNAVVLASRFAWLFQLLCCCFLARSNEVHVHDISLRISNIIWKWNFKSHFLFQPLLWKKYFCHFLSADRTVVSSFTSHLLTYFKEYLEFKIILVFPS